MLLKILMILPLLVVSTRGGCGSVRWPSHIYEERTEILEGENIISRDNTIYEVSKNENETVVEQITNSATTFEDVDNEEANDKEENSKIKSNLFLSGGLLQTPFDADVENWSQRFGNSYDDDEDDLDEREMDEWTKNHYKKIKGLRLLQNETQEIVLPQSGTMVCWTNVCHEMDVVIHRVQIIAPSGFTIQCLDGGVGSYKMAFEVRGLPGMVGKMSAKMWGSYVPGNRYIWITDGIWPYQCGEVMSHC